MTEAEAPAGGANQALWTSTAAFTACFAVWTTFSIIGIGVKDQLGLSETEFGLLVGTPILTGSLIRIILGVWADQIGGRRVFAGVMLAAAVATYLTSYANTYGELLIAALGVGIAGGSFSLGITYVSKFFPQAKQGTALGIFGAGNVGAAVTKFVAPFVMVAAGWQVVAQVWAAGLVVMAVLFLALTKEDPEQRARVIRAAISDFARFASEEDWATLTSTLKRSEDPGTACLLAMVDWRLTARTCRDHSHQH